MPRYISNVADSPKYTTLINVLNAQFRKLLGTLNYIHSKGIVHLDIKSHDIFVDGNGE
jgi:serine/threonine protein kinase